MDKIDELLEDVRKSNPEMTRERLISELSKSRYATAGLWNTYKNSAKNFVPLLYLKNRCCQKDTIQAKPHNSQPLQTQIPDRSNPHKKHDRIFYLIFYGFHL